MTPRREVVLKLFLRECGDEQGLKTLNTIRRLERRKPSPLIDRLILIAVVMIITVISLMAIGLLFEAAVEIARS